VSLNLKDEKFLTQIVSLVDSLGIEALYKQTVIVLPGEIKKATHETNAKNATDTTIGEKFAAIILA